mmetsp:Transcript_33701/g.67112  ORF Transcript_33701/g.67112 Transcript_33701/m.67112 type:complete len:217 (+) Transcript_33701:265-915(+)
MPASASLCTHGSLCARAFRPRICSMAHCSRTAVDRRSGARKQLSYRHRARSLWAIVRSRPQHSAATSTLSHSALDCLILGITDGELQQRLPLVKVEVLAGGAASVNLLDILGRLLLRYHFLPRLLARHLAAHRSLYLLRRLALLGNGPARRLPSPCRLQLDRRLLPLLAEQLRLMPLGVATAVGLHAHYGLDFLIRHRAACLSVSNLLHLHLHLSV